MKLEVVVEIWLNQASNFENLKTSQNEQKILMLDLDRVSIENFARVPKFITDAQCATILATPQTPGTLTNVKAVTV
ncbi:hypothetical protein [Clostridium estertheticum]|uniref:hypothetical protein n=1 Tax=Clostridium estertheticum TaxID=238834 RepID=UPI001C7DE1ED|nr:hypothetical protein [Clostridium estertheticum]MBX4271460.1 hypothetical protein [Clostridium estertheticum]WLC81013.1 hypothetical protein KTC98_07255 [Clostridium estertheticum]